MRNLLKLTLVLLVAAILHQMIYLSGVVSLVDFNIFDVMSNQQSDSSTPHFESIVVVEIDEKSLQNFGQWPWPRIILAKVLQEILVQKPAAVGIDIFFPESDRTSPIHLKNFYKTVLDIDVQMDGFPLRLEDHDLILASVLASGPTVLPLFSSQQGESSLDCPLPTASLLPIPKGLDIPDSPHLLCNTQLLQQAAQGFGFINSSTDSDGTFRRQGLLVQHKNQGLPSLALAMLAQVDPDIKILPPEKPLSPIKISFANKTISINQRGEILNFSYKKESFKRISASTLVSGDIPIDFFTGKMVLVGASAAGLYDQYRTPHGDILPGVFIHASLLANILHGKGIYQPEMTKKIALALSYLLSTVVIFLVIKRNYLSSWGVYLSFSSISLLLAWFLLKRGLYVSLGYFLTPFSFLFFLISLFFAVLHYIERKRFLEDLDHAHSATIDSMTMVAESRDVETGAHIIRTKEYVVMLAQTLFFHGYHKSELTPHLIDLLHRAAPLHDIGKVGIPDSILCKPGSLTKEEFEIMKTHVNIGHSIIENAIHSYNKTNEFLTIASNIAYSHHEHWDGSGYPLGLKGEDIPLEGRLMALADVYDALISPRCYKSAISYTEAEQMIIEKSGSHFDPIVVQAFNEKREEFRKVAQKNQEEDNPEIPILSPAKIP